MSRHQTVTVFRAQPGSDLLELKLKYLPRVDPLNFSQFVNSAACQTSSRPGAVGPIQRKRMKGFGEETSVWS